MAHSKCIMRPTSRTCVSFRWIWKLCLAVLAIVVVLLLCLISIVLFPRTLGDNSSNEDISRDILALTPRSDPTASFKIGPFQGSLDSDRKDRIPKIIHQTWKSQDAIPEKFRISMESWLKINEGWEYWFWTDHDMKLFVERVFIKYLSLCNHYPKQIYKADVFRYMVLYKYGGLYADLDVECLKPLDPVIDQHSCILSQEPEEHPHFLFNRDPPMVSNALMACRPGHPFFEQLLAGLQRRFSSDIQKATGPMMLSDVSRDYIVRQNVSFNGSSAGVPNPDRLHIADPDLFQPTPDPGTIGGLRQQCQSDSQHHATREDLHKRLCARVLSPNYPTIHPGSITNHQWAHTYIVSMPPGLFHIKNLLQQHVKKLETFKFLPDQIRNFEKKKKDEVDSSGSRQWRHW